LLLYLAQTSRRTVYTKNQKSSQWELFYYKKIKIQ
jgi:hypothetical protein